jgi:septal ring factor EnvC (AmiA/AmiB activator)
MTAWLLALALAAGDVEDEHDALAARLAAEKAALEAVTDERKDLLTLLDTLERLARQSAARAATLEQVAARVGLAVSRARAESGALDAARRRQERRLAPRLATLYRLTRRDGLAALLSAGDFAALVRQQRAVREVVSADVRELEALALLADSGRRQAARLERLEATAARTLAALRAEQAVGAARLSRFKDLLASVKAEENRMSRLVAELERTEAQLATMVSELKGAAPATGFRSRRGQLPYPADGLVEVGFGKVVNPRFNTVTVQKGIDLRAPAGAEVRSVGVGTVVYAGWLKGYGNLVIVDHGDGYHSLYAHLAMSQVEVGNEVEEGEAIGQVGDTGSLKGSYLYFEIRRGGQAIDPLPWLRAQE